MPDDTQRWLAGDWTGFTWEEWRNGRVCHNKVLSKSEWHDPSEKMWTYRFEVPGEGGAGSYVSEDELRNLAFFRQIYHVRIADEPGNLSLWLLTDESKSGIADFQAETVNHVTWVLQTEDFIVYVSLDATQLPAENIRSAFNTLIVHMVQRHRDKTE